jgi:hypothetical protein
MKYEKISVDKKKEKEKGKEKGKEKVKNKEEKFFYVTNILTKVNKNEPNIRNKVSVTMEIKNSKLFIQCSYQKNYFTKTFSNSFTLDELKNQCNYFKQFMDETQLLKEIALIKNQNPQLKDFISSNEESSHTIRLNITLPVINYSTIGFNLKEEPKSQNHILSEYKFIIKNYEKKFKIDNFNSIILLDKDAEKEAIKFWISPNKMLNAELLFSFNDKLPDTENNMTVNSFHRECDNKSSILMICKSNKEIFGGYTPLSFDSSDDYKNDNESFLFSINRLEKYPKDSYNRSKSIWCYREYGPSFHYDLYFRTNKINAVKFERTNYLTPDHWVNRSNCYTNELGVHLDSLEIYKIRKSGYRIEEFVYNEDFNSQFIENNYDDNIIKDNDDCIDFEINNKKSNKNLIYSDEIFSNKKKINNKNNNNINEKEILINNKTPLNNNKKPQDTKMKTDKIKKDLKEEKNNEKNKDNSDNSSKKKSEKNENDNTNKEDKENNNILVNNIIEDKKICENINIIEDNNVKNLEENVEESDSDEERI